MRCPELVYGVGWHAHAAFRVGMPCGKGNSMPSEQRAGHATPVTDAVLADE